MPIISVSRQMGSFGDLIASLVAERLNLLFVDRGMFVSLLQERGLSLAEALSTESEETPQDFWGRLAEQRRRTGILLGTILYELAMTDRLLVLGHGAEVLFRGVGHVLRVKVAAPFEVRTTRVAQQEAIKREAASAMVRQSDEDAFGYMRYLFQANWMESESYDLFVNTETIGVPSAVNLIARAAAAPELAPREASLAALRDRALANRVELALLRDQGVRSAGIEVVAQGEMVVLNGFVRSDEQRLMAEEVTRRVDGVVEVRNELAILSESEG
jgi:osmotically-inducible protein OsmY